MKRFAIPLLAALLLLVAQPALALGDAEKEILALVAMPLAVAAVADITDVPIAELASVVATLNNALVPPTQVIEVLRYAPVALVDTTIEPDFDDWLAAQLNQGTTGTQLVTVVERRFIEYGVPKVEPLAVVRPVLVRETEFFPVPVRALITERSSHPHGGPPGQLKKQRGLQTGAQVVHEMESAVRELRTDEKKARKEARNRREKVDDTPRIRTTVPMISSGSDVRPGKGRDDDGRGGKEKVKVKDDDDGKGHGHRGGHGNKGGGHGKGKGKG